MSLVRSAGVFGLVLLTVCESPTTTSHVDTTKAQRFSSPYIVPSTALLTPGDTLRLTAKVFDAEAKAFVVRPTVWRSTDTSVALIDTIGLVRAKNRDGYSRIDATIEGLSVSTTVTVEAAAYVFPDTNVLLPGMQRDLRVESFTGKAGLKQLSGAVWSSTNPSVASVDANGHVTAKSVGEATIIADVSGSSPSAKIYVKQLASSLRFVQVSAVGGIVCAMEAGGDVYCWGDLGVRDDPAQVMDRCESVTPPSSYPPFGYTRRRSRCSALPVLVKPERPPARLIPRSLWALAADSTLVPLIRPVESVGAAGFQFADVTLDFHRCGIQASARGYCWNTNVQGELGNGTVQSTGPWSPAPSEIAGDKRWLVVKPGPHYSTCGLTTVGEAYCWGYDLTFRLGIGTDYTSACNSPPGLGCVATPMLVRADTRFTALATTSHNTCALAIDRRTFCWGERPDNVPASEAGLPVVVSGAPAFKSLVGRDQIWGIDDAGNVHTLVRNESATSFAAVFSFAPASLPFAVKVLAPQASFLTSCAISASDDKLYCWGAANQKGTMGNGTLTDAPVSAPALVLGQNP
jgi:hypothetical protein